MDTNFLGVQNIFWGMAFVTKCLLSHYFKRQFHKGTGPLKLVTYLSFLMSPSSAGQCSSNTMRGKVEEERAEDSSAKRSKYSRIAAKLPKPCPRMAGLDGVVERFACMH